MINTSIPGNLKMNNRYKLKSVYASDCFTVLFNSKGFAEGIMLSSSVTEKTSYGPAKSSNSISLNKRIPMFFILLFLVSRLHVNNRDTSRMAVSVSI